MERKTDRVDRLIRVLGAARVAEPPVVGIAWRAGVMAAVRTEAADRSRAGWLSPDLVRVLYPAAAATATAALVLVWASWGSVVAGGLERDLLGIVAEDPAGLARLAGLGL